MWSPSIKLYENYVECWYYVRWKLYVPLHILQVSTQIEFTVHSDEHLCEWCTRRMLCFSQGIFFVHEHVDVRGIINHKFVELGTTVNVPYYKTALQNVKKAVKKKIGSDQYWFLHHDNALTPCSLTVQQYLTKKVVTAIPDPPYSPDLSSCDFFIVPQFKQMMKGKRF